MGGGGSLEAVICLGWMAVFFMLWENERYGTTWMATAMAMAKTANRGTHRLVRVRLKSTLLCSAIFCISRMVRLFKPGISLCLCPRHRPRFDSAARYNMNESRRSKAGTRLSTDERMHPPLCKKTEYLAFCSPSIGTIPPPTGFGAWNGAGRVCRSYCCSGQLWWGDNVCS